MAFSDNELMMLEQMTYIGDACEMAGVSASQVCGDTIEERLYVFTNDALKRLESKGSEGQQWAAIIRYLKGNGELRTLVQGENFTDKDGVVLGTAYYHKDHPGDAIVTFHGTTTGENWYDNATGLGNADTNVQKNALSYIEGLPYTNIEVVGHSKGGNLAQYVTIRSDKVNRCISMDGQGFSEEFINQYWAEIELKGSCITNYSLSDDFVHILLYPIPNSKQDYCTGDRVDSVIEKHYANSFFQYETICDETGNPITVVKTNSDGVPVVINGQKENEMMTYLHQFTCFVLSTMPEDQRVEMGDYIGNILYLAMIDNPAPIIGKDGKKYDKVAEYIFSDEERFSKLIAYIAKYVENYNLTEKEVRALMSMLGMDFFVDKLEECYVDLGFVIEGGGSILMLFLNNIKDGERDYIIEALLDKLSEVLKGINIDCNLVEIWQNTEKEYLNIPKVKKNANQDIAGRKGRTYKYTRDLYEMLRGSMASLHGLKFPNIAGWNEYEGRSWFKKIFAQIFLNAAEKYNSKLEDLYFEGKKQVELAFQVVDKVDRECSQQLEQYISDVNVLITATK